MAKLVPSKGYCSAGYYKTAVAKNNLVQKVLKPTELQVFLTNQNLGNENDRAEFCISISFFDGRQEEVAKNLLAEFNLGCDVHQNEHVYRVYVATFLGFGGNAAQQRYADNIFTSTVLRNRCCSVIHLLPNYNFSEMLSIKSLNRAHATKWRLYFHP